MDLYIPVLHHHLTLHSILSLFGVIVVFRPTLQHLRVYSVIFHSRSLLLEAREFS